MKFITFTTHDKRIINEILNPNSSQLSGFDLLLEKIQNCNFRLILISQFTLNQEKLDSSNLDQKLIKDLHFAWKTILGLGLVDIDAQKKAWSTIDSIGEEIQSIRSPSSPVLRRFIKDDHSFILLVRKHPTDLPIFELNFLCNLGQLENQVIPIHSSGVVHNGKLFLFGGPSGVGKSTISNLSANQRDWVLDEDQLLLKPREDGSCQAQAWGYSLQGTDAPLTAIFKLVKDTEDRLIPLSKLQTTCFLLERTMEVIGFMLEKKHVKQVFRQAAGLARSIPGYELHFRKSPDFWKLIDAEFPLD